MCIHNKRNANGTALTQSAHSYWEFLAEAVGKRTRFTLLVHVNWWLSWRAPESSLEVSVQTRIHQHICFKPASYRCICQHVRHVYGVVHWSVVLIADTVNNCFNHLHSKQLGCPMWGCQKKVWFIHQLSSCEKEQRIFLCINMKRSSSGENKEQTSVQDSVGYQMQEARLACVLWGNSGRMHKKLTTVGCREGDLGTRQT